jgi:hypothetical protein
MKRTTIFLDEVVECDLQALARQRGRRVAELVREALTDYLSREKAAGSPRLRFVGVGRSGETDVAERHEELVFAGLTPHGEARAARPRKRPARAAAKTRRGAARAR